MKKTNTDLIVGASILIACIILVVGVLWLKEVSVTRKNVSYTVLFPNVGTLQLGDPVMVNGVKKGAVANIFLRGTEVCAILELDKTVPITDSTQITVQNIGLLGERGVGVLLSSKGNRIPFNSKADTVFIRGTFDTGIAEAMGMLGTVLSEVETLVVSVGGIVEETVGDTAFLRTFHTIVARLDTVSVVAQKLVAKNEPLINQSVRNLAAVSADLKALVDKNSGSISAMAANGEELTARSLAVVSQVESLTVSVQTVLKKVENGEGSLGKLYKDEQFYTDLKHTVASLDTLVNEVQNDALKLRIRLGFGRKKK